MLDKRPGSAVSVTSGETSGTDSHTDTQFLMSSDSGKLGNLLTKKYTYSVMNNDK